MPAKRDTLYTKAELARHFHIPESTIRYYCARFAPWLPCEGEGRRTRYMAACLEVLAFIRKRLPEVRTGSAMEGLLRESFPAQKEPRQVRPEKKADTGIESTIPVHFARCRLPENPGSLRADVTAQPVSPGISDASALALQLLERQGAALERIADGLAVLSEQGKAARQLGERADMTERELELLRKETQTLRLLLDASEKTQQQDLEQIRKWMGKVINERKTGQ